jgi:Outer membrane protein beta-barrel domain
MKKIVLALAVASLGMIPSAKAQATPNHVELGIFAEYTNFEQTHTNSVGLGGRFAFNANKHFQLEGEMGYEFDQAFTEGFTDTGTGTVSVARSNFHILDGLFGPKIQTSGRVRLFATVKGGFIHTGLSNAPGSFAGFVSSVQDLRITNTDGAFYPGVGVEGFLGPIGLRLDVGDLMYFNSGVHHDLRVTFGPTIRF